MVSKKSSNLIRLLVLSLLILGLGLSPFQLASASEKITLKVATIGHSGDIRTAYYTMAYEFERLNPGVKIEFIIKSDTLFKATLPEMLKQEGAVDIVNWHAGERLTHFIDQGLVLPISNLWQTQKLDDEFTAVSKQIVSYKGDVWAVPTSYYQWGFYYKKSLFKRLGVSPPEDWQQFINLLTRLKQDEIVPIYIGSKNLWPIGNWFEYLNLRINGLAYHQAFVKGEMSAYDDGIRRVLSHWQQLIKAGFFYDKHQGRDLADGFPLIYRGQAAIVLAGHMIESYMSEKVVDDIGFFSFPRIANKIETTQVTPVDVMFIAKSSKNREMAKKFITFAANKNVQTELNANLNQFPVNKYSMVFGNNLLLTIMDSIIGAEGLTYFYDREVEEIYGQENLAIWKEFLNQADIKKTMVKMEQARLAYLARKSP